MKKKEMNHSKNTNILDDNRGFWSRHRVDLIIVLVPVALILLWILARPYYFAGCKNSGNLLLLAEMIAVLLIFSIVGGCIYLVSRLLIHLKHRRIKPCLTCCIFLCAIIFMFLLFRLTAKSQHFKFEHGFQQWVLKKADLKAIHNWRSTLEINVNGLPREITKNDWPHFIGILSPESVNCESSDFGCVELVVRWRGGIKRVYGLTVRPINEKKPYSPNWNGPILEVSRGVYVWWF